MTELPLASSIRTPEVNCKTLGQKLRRGCGAGTAEALWEMGRRMEEASGTPENEDGIVHQQPLYDDRECGERRRPPGSGSGQRA